MFCFVIITGCGAREIINEDVNVESESVNLDKVEEKETEIVDVNMLQSSEAAREQLINNFDSVSNVVSKEYEGYLGDVYAPYKDIEVSDKEKIQILRKLADDGNYYYYEIVQKQKKLVETGKYYNDGFYVDLFDFADLNQDGIKEIIINSYTNSTVGLSLGQSTILYKKGDLWKCENILSYVDGELLIASSDKYTYEDFQIFYEEKKDCYYYGYNVAGVFTKDNEINIEIEIIGVDEKENIKFIEKKLNTTYFFNLDFQLLKNSDLRQTEESIVGSENTNTEVVTEKINQESVEQVHQNEMIYEDYYELLVAEYDAVCEAVDSFYEGILGEVYKPYTNIKISEELSIEINRVVNEKEKKVHYEFIDNNKNDISGISKEYKDINYYIQMFKFVDLNEDGSNEILIQSYTENSSGIAMADSTIYYYMDNKWKNFNLLSCEEDGIFLGNGKSYTDLELTEIYRNVYSKDNDGFHPLGIEKREDGIYIYFLFTVKEDEMWKPYLFHSIYDFDKTNNLIEICEFAS